jgi:hypothetical protein
MGKRLSSEHIAWQGIAADRSGRARVEYHSAADGWVVGHVIRASGELLIIAAIPKIGPVFTAIAKPGNGAGCWRKIPWSRQEGGV